MKTVQVVPLALLCLVWIACDSLIPAKPAQDALLDGPMQGLSTEENSRFLAGDAAFNNEVFTPATGLGPLFVATSCGSCHAGDGKGHPFTTLTRFGQTDETGNTYLAHGGPQLQNRAIPGFEPEQLPAGTGASKFTPPINTGLGYLAALSDEQILTHADPSDLDGDGISGVPNYIIPPDYFLPLAIHQPHNGKYIGRFGKKAAAIDLLHQTVNAYNQDIGITSSFNPIDPCTGHIMDPEVTDKTVHNVVFYLRTLKAPIQRTPQDNAILQGRQLFAETGCAACHVPTWVTPASDIAALSNKTFSPYTDLLLHDMGPGLDDGYTEGTAKTSEWRTPPLWGLGLAPIAQGGQYYLLHDGRAHSIREAIEQHGGEATPARNRFMQLTATEQENLLRFLQSL